MAQSWVETEDGRYRRVLRTSAGDVHGVIRQDGAVYRWQESAYVGLQYGQSRSLHGAKRACGRAMQFFRRWIEADN